ncbi:MAG: hypothetical protein KC656_11445 [Myxococcales bacterium]|nr:hypothetical protein [Myxococcales bacterium]MCB9693090.1 hypothetical protein [Alphaproteobacteria bacterium]
MSELKRDELLERITARYRDEWRMEAWERWLATVRDEDLDAESAIIDSLLRTDWALASYRLASLHLGSPLALDERRVLARLLLGRHVTHAGAFTLVEELVAMAPEAREARVQELDARSRLPSLDGVHSLLANALRAIPPELWPTEPLHAGETRPDIGVPGYPALARALQSWVDDPALKDRMRQAEERETAQRRPDMMGASLRPHLQAVVRALAASERPTDATELLVRMDDELRRLDIVQALAKRKQTPSRPVAAAVYRGADDKDVRVRLARLDDGRFGLQCKLGGRYRWIEGDREDVLASVPEDWFADAVAAAR